MKSQEIIQRPSTNSNKYINLMDTLWRCIILNINLFIIRISKLNFYSLEFILQNLQTNFEKGTADIFVIPCL